MNAPANITVIPAAQAVYAKISAVQAALAKSGIAKSRRNTTQGYQFRGIDEIYDALSPLLAEHGLCILPRIISRDFIERNTAKGGVLFYVTVEAEFDFVAAEDGSKHVVRTFGEAMDSADKATNKAMSAAYKYAALMAFAIPTEGDNDADATTHDVAPSSAQDEPQGMPDAEWAKLAGLIKATGSQTGAMCKHFRVENLRMLSQDAYGQAIAMLKKKLAKMAREQANTQAATPAASAFDDAAADDCPF